MSIWPREKVTCVVIESTSDYWRPFYYLLDDDLDVMLVNAARCAMCRAARPMSPMLPGWPIWAPTGWSGRRSCRRHRSGSCGI